MVLGPLNLEVRRTDAFVADIIALNPGHAIATVRTTPELLLLDMEAASLIETADVPRPHIQLL